MPDHIHLLISEPGKGDPSRVMQVIRQGFSRRVLKACASAELPPGRSCSHSGQRRFYDFKIWTARKRIEKLRYMHRNPVMRGLVQEPEQWPWSSYWSYAFGRANQSVGSGQDENPDAACGSPEFAKNAKVGQPRGADEIAVSLRNFVGSSRSAAKGQI